MLMRTAAQIFSKIFISNEDPEFTYETARRLHLQHQRSLEASGFHEEVLRHPYIREVALRTQAISILDQVKCSGLWMWEENLSQAPKAKKVQLSVKYQRVT